MALIVENGTGKDDAESYATVAEADAYHVSRGNSAWANATELEKEIALRKGTEWIDLTFGGRFSGWTPVLTQRLKWPRYGVMNYNGDLISSNIVPEKVKFATYEMALAALTEDIIETITNPGTIARTKSKIGALEDEIEYASGGAEQVKKYRRAEMLLAEYISEGLGTAVIVRS